VGSNGQCGPTAIGEVGLHCGHQAAGGCHMPPAEAIAQLRVGLPAPCLMALAGTTTTTTTAQDK